MKKSPKEPAPKGAKDRAREEQLREILQDADLKKFDPELARVTIARTPKRKPSKAR